jgi:vancomycin resistance protein YoaR
MSATSAAKRNAGPQISPLPKFLTALAIGFVLFLALLVGAGSLYAFSFSGLIYPGISMAGIDLAGLRVDEAEQLLASRLTFPTSGKIVFQDGEAVWVAKPSELGLIFDAAANAQAAYQFGRQGNPLLRTYRRLAAWYSGRNLAPQFTYDERQAQAYLAGLAKQVDRPTIEAALSLNGTQVSATPGQIGRQVDLPATLAPLEGQLLSMADGILTLVVNESPPEILDASQQAETAQKILSAPLVLQLPDAGEGSPGPWTIEPQQLAQMLALQRVADPAGASYQVELNLSGLRPTLEQAAQQIYRLQENARFIFNDDTRQLEVIEKAVTGRALDIEATLANTQQKLMEGEHSIQLAIDTTEPEVGDNARGGSLGITELVSVHTSHFRGSSQARMQNIEMAAARFHGLLVPPGAIFSMAEAMGDVSLDEGYAEALIIFGGRTIKGVGGGVCQVSTTLFRTVFLGGYPVIERNPHAYRVGYYEQNSGGYDSNLAGLDATVFVPVVDFKFQNDTPYWLLMETYFNPKKQTLTWKFYSTSDGRSVEWDTSGPTNVVEPPDPLYEENPDLAEGEIKQVDWAAEGADVTITRTVTRNGQVLFTDTFTTHYQPWRDIYQYGPGTDIDDIQNSG